MKDWIGISFSNIGKRESNQDIVISKTIVYRHKRYYLLMVCDGVGGRPFGAETASCVAKEVEILISNYLKKRKSRTKLNSSDLLIISFILQNIKKLDVPPSGRTTLALTVVDLNKDKKGYHSISIWAGDSRIYFIDEDGLCQQISNDQYGIDHNLSSVFGGDGKLHGQLGMDVMISKNPIAYIITSDGMNSVLKNLFQFFYSVISYKLRSNEIFEYKATAFLGKIISDNYTCSLLYREKIGKSLFESYNKMKIVTKENQNDTF